MLVTVPERLTYVRILTTKDLVDELLNKLQDLGAVHTEHVAKLPEEDRKRVMAELEKVEKLKNIVSNFESLLGTPKLIEVKEVVRASELGSYVSKLLDKLSESYEKAVVIENNLERLKKDLTEYRKLAQVLEAMRNDPKLSQLHLGDVCFRGLIVSSAVLLGSETGIRDLERYIRSKNLEVYVIGRARLGDEKAVYVVAGPTCSIDDLVYQARKLNIEEVSLPTKKVKPGEFLKEVNNRLRTLERMISDVTENLEKLLNSIIQDLALAKIVSEIWEERVNVLLSALSGDYLIAIEGWVPTSQLSLIINELYSSIKYVYVSKVDSGREPPTKMRNPRPIKPFELITKIYGIPNYREWDPTPIISYSLMLFFGLMFADVVYGILMLIIVNYVLERIGLVENPYSEGYLRFKKLLTILSISSIVFGLLSNSYAGYSIVFRNGRILLVAASGSSIQAVLPILNPTFFLKIALVIGLVHVNIAHVLALLKYIRGKEKGELISKIGFFITEIFGIPYVLYAFLNYQLPGVLGQYSNYLLYPTLAGLALLIAGKFVAYRALGALFWLFDLTGLLGDVMSYTRLAGLGLATSLLAQNFNNLAIDVATGISGMVPVKLLGLLIGGFAAVLVMFFTNLLNITFGIIGAFIHSLRLCFVEFLPKFYEGDGREFKPFMLRIEKAVYIGPRSSV